MRKPLTPQQLELLHFLRDYIAAHGISPTVSDMAKALGKRSKGSIGALLNALEDAGLISRDRYCARGVYVHGDACPHCGQDMPERKQKRINGATHERA